MRHPDTGEVMTPDELAGKVTLIAGELESLSRELRRKIHEHGRVAHEYAKVYRRALRASEGASIEDRKADAETACDNTHLADSPLDLGTRKAVLETEIRELKSLGHDFRSVLSAYQTASANIRAALSAGGGVS